MIKIILLWLALFFSNSAFAEGTGISSILRDPVTTSFVIINIFLMVYFNYKFDRFSVVHGPEILTTVGIFGCFLGIALALLDFDAAKVSTSVPKLLEGVKTAFWSSVSGIFGSLLIKARYRFHKEPILQSPGSVKAASLDDVVIALESLKTSFIGDGENSLITQFKLMRAEQTELSKKLIHSFDEFSERMVQDNSNALIEALREVIKDFNAQINEQFGENFKLLNSAVEKLVVWQQQYKEVLDQLQNVQNIAAGNLRQASDSFSHIVDQSKDFASIATQLKELMIGLSNQYSLIKNSQSDLAEVLSKLEKIGPEFIQNLDKVSITLQQTASKMEAELSAVINSLAKQTGNATTDMKNLLGEALKSNQEKVNEELSKGLKVIEQGVLSLDEGLQVELTKSLETLGRQMASLSQRFVEDYSPLTDKLREIVQLAQQVR